MDGGPGPRLVLSIRYQLPDGGVAPIAFEPSIGGQIDPTTYLDITSNQTLVNCRIRIFDELDRAVASDDRSNQRPEGIEYQISLVEALKPGYSYELVVDGESGQALTDRQGNVFSNQRFKLQVHGVKEKPKLPKRSKRRRGGSR